MAANEPQGQPSAAPSPALLGVDAAAWDRLRAGVEAETGMDFSGSRLKRLQDAVHKTLAARRDVALPDLLTSPQEHAPFLERLTAELTIGESYFFRNEHHFRALREQVAPQILAENASRREIRAWSAGCAGGEEPYSLAILLDQLLADRGDWRISILATDLNPVFLERARQGRYRPWSFRHTTIHQDQRYFLPSGEEFRLAERVRNYVRFGYLNLVKDVYPSSLTGTLGLDLIVFRNVAIYLKPPVTAAILARFHGALRPGGWLLLGETEVSTTPAAGFEVQRFGQATFFQKKEAAVGVAPVLTAPWAAPLGPAAGPAATLPRPLPSSQPVAPPPPIARVVAPASHVAPPRAPASPASASSAPIAEPQDPLSWERLERWIAERRFDEVEKALLRGGGRKQRAPIRLRYAQALLGVAETARARRMVETCLVEEPLLLEAHLLQASFAEDAGDLAAAEAAYRRALYLDRNSPMAHFHLALVQQQQGDSAGAARSLRTLVSLIAAQDPQAPVPYGEGVCFGRLKEMAEVLLTS